MSEFGDGFKGAISSAIGSVISSAMLTAFAATGLLPAGYLLLIGLVNFIPTITLLRSVPMWGLVYSGGWLFGAIIMIFAFPEGLLSIWDKLTILAAPIGGIALWVLRFRDE